jgi:hypothetical protein
MGQTSTGVTTMPATWTDDDFRTVFAFLGDIKAAMGDMKCLTDNLPLLQKERDDAAAAFARIFDAVAC